MIRLINLIKMQCGKRTYWRAGRYDENGRWVDGRLVSASTEREAHGMIYLIKLDETDWRFAENREAAQTIINLARATGKEPRTFTLNDAIEQPADHFDE